MSATFGEKSTTDDVLRGVDLTGKRILVTGVSAGLGVETARSLAARGAHVLGAARDLDKARSATAGIANLELIQLDLADLASVRAAADTLIAGGRKFDVVIANAGVMACPKGTTRDGFETQFGTNHLGHFVFINRIAGLIKDDGGRLVNLSSAGHRFADVDLEDPNFEHTPYAEFVAYGRSKTANILFAVEFDRRHKARGVRAAAVHPGGIQTELGRHMTPELIQGMMDSVTRAQAAAGGPAVPGSVRYRVSDRRLWYSWAYIDAVRKVARNKLIVKGILDPEDAKLAIEHGADAIIVSNHGGRSMDYGPSTLEVLPEIVAAVNGRIPVLFDSGIRRGADIFKALALGANGVSLGRSARWGLGAFGSLGAQRVFEILQAELVQVAAAAGCTRLSDINKTMVKTHFV